MLKLWAKTEAWFRSDDGATAIEYGLIAAGIAVAIAAAVFALGDDLRTMFNNVETEITTRNAGMAGGGGGGGGT